MCIIIAKRAGVNLDLQELKDAAKTASLHNCHGTGFAVKRENSENIILSKGYKYYEVALETLEKMKIQKGDELMFHMRYATAGEVDVENCHPYVVADNLKDILVDEAVITNNAVVSHNGTFDYYTDKKSNYSDTVHYVKEYLSEEGVLESMRNIEYASYYQMYRLMGNNKLCIIHPDVNLDMDTFGYWNMRKKESLIYSNYYHIQPFNGYQLEAASKHKVVS
jgi:predicted glutamine amidotransferase